jgi:glucose/mannose-6-phosphate isomerase
MFKTIRKNMIKLDNLEKIDSQKMYKIYDEWPKMAEEAFYFEHKKIEFKKINHIIFTGMGGSGTIGDIFSSILSKTNIHVTVVKGYTLPKTVSEKSLVITTSISGNTIETLTALEDAVSKKCKIIAFCSGGKMEEYCKKNKLEFRKFKKIHSPRASFTVFLYGMLNVLSPILPISEIEIKESLEELKNLSKNINSNAINNKNPAYQLANWINYTPIIYYPFGLQAAAIRFKNALQENAKTHALVEDVIESCHNGIVAWEKSKEFQAILLQGENDYIKTKERWGIFKEFFNENNLDYWETHSIKGNILSKIITLIYLYDYCSIYLAIKNGIDPSPVESIDFIKNKTQTNKS